jgi:thiol-disulfide isomerase/thioredoxin/Flp pilus assembly protein TadD
MTTLRFLLTGLLTATLAVPAVAQDFTVRPYRLSAAAVALEAARDSVDSFLAYRAIARDYQARYPDDVAVQLQVSNFLAMDDVDSTRSFYRARAERLPDNELAQYLAGRLMPRPEDQRTYADRLLARDPNSYWGNLLLAGTFTPDNDPGFKQAEAALRKAIAKDNSLPYAVEKLGIVLRTRGDKEQADAVFVKLARMEPDRFEPIQDRISLVVPDQRKAIALIDEFLDRNPKNVQALYAKARAQRELNDWPGHVATMRRVVEAAHTGDHAYDLACGLSLAGQKDSAFVWLNNAVELGYTDIEQYKNDEDLVPLRDDPRWSDLLAHVQKADQARLAEILRKAAENAPQRRLAALTERLTSVAPEFTVFDLDSHKVSLSDLRGKVVILDFWATWCAPCRKTMPLVEKFYTQSRPEGVLLFGMNVWERSPDKVKPFIEKAGYHFPILRGTNEIASAYNVSGIPTLVVIDKQGKIAYRHIGYDPTLPEVLTWQTKELLK